MFRSGYCNILAAILGTSIALAPPAEAQSATKPIPRRLTLMQAENLLIERNFTVLAAKYQVEAGRAARLIAAYKPNPVLTVGAEQLPFYSPLEGSFPRFASTNSDAGANPVYTLRIDKIWERGGKREFRTTLADEQLRSSEAQMLDVIRTQIFQLRNAFTAAILAREDIRLAETTEQQYAQTESLTQVKVDQGDIAKVEIYRVSAGRLQYQQAVLQASTAYDDAVRQILNLLGARENDVEPATANATAVDAGIGDPLTSTPRMLESIRNAPLELFGDFSDRPVLETREELRAAALAERPDVLAARHQLASAEEASQIARAQRSRDIDIAYEYQRTGSDHTAGVIVQFPLFISNDQRALFTQAEAQRRAAEAQLKQAELQALTDVDKAYQSYLTARRILELYNTQNLSKVEKLRDIAAFSYQEGGTSLFEFLDAQRAYSAGMTAYAQARSDYEMSLWGLEQAAGRSLR